MEHYSRICQIVNSWLILSQGKRFYGLYLFFDLSGKMGIILILLLPPVAVALGTALVPPPSKPQADLYTDIEISDVTSPAPTQLLWQEDIPAGLTL